VAGSAPSVRAERAATVIWSSWSRGERLTRLPDECLPRDMEEASAAQDALEAIVGERFGWKLAATSEAGQRHIGVQSPLHGRLFSRFVYASGERLSARGMHMRVAEAEFAFRLGQDVSGPGPHTLPKVLEAVDSLHLSIELPDSRFNDFECAGGPQLLADDACAGRFVFGPAVPSWAGLDLAEQAVSVRINGAEVARGSGANVLSDPREALVWLANELPRHGLALRAGEVVTTGVTTIPVPVRAGDCVIAEFPELGSVSVNLTD
jgi:2-keto-4-pentenoate hydratase